MTKILTPQTKNLEPSNQVTNKDEKIFEKEEYQAIYRAFLDILENLEKQTKQEIEKKKQKLKEELSDQEKQKLQSDMESLVKQLKQLNNEDEKKIFTFVSKNHEGIFKNVKPEDIKPLSEENFCQFLLSVFKEIREQGLAREEKLNNDKIQQIITKCVADIRGTEAKDSSIKFVLEMLLLLIGGIKIDPKNISGSFMDGMKEKIPFLGKDKKEEDEPPLSDEEMVTTFLSKIFFPVLLSIASISIFGPTTLAVVAAAVGAIFAIKGGVGVLFSNNKKGTLYDPHSRDEKERKEWGNEISDGINEILKSGVNETGQGNQPAVTAEEQLTQKSKQSTVLEQVTLDQPAKSTGQQP